eukprot:1235859-Prymnesium_polylepis.1
MMSCTWSALAYAYRALAAAFADPSPLSSRMTAVVDLAATAPRHARLNLLWRPILLSPLVIVSPTRVDRSARRAPRAPRARHSARERRCREEEAEAPLRSRARDGRARGTVGSGVAVTQ